MGALVNVSFNHDPFLTLTVFITVTTMTKL